MGNQESTVLYKPLAAARSEIRLLVLWPSSVRGDDVQASLHTVSLDDAPDFEALSYVWGDQNVRTAITVNSEIMLVTTALGACLRRLHNASEPRVLWVDAVCINQNNIAEKNIQVPLMRRIYADATSVVVWLGEGSKNIELALSWAEVYIANESSSPLSRYWRYLESQTEPSQKVGREQFVALVNAFRGYYDLLNLKYWTRMWTFQEFRLPLDEPTCVYGCHIVTASTLVGNGWHTLPTLVIKLSTRVNIRYLLDLDINGRPIVSIGQEQEVEQINQLDIASLEEALELGRSLFVHPPDSMASLRDSLDWASSIGLKPRRETAIDVAASIQLIRTYRPEQEPDFVELLLLTVGRESFDPRDRFYGVYGLAPEIQRKFPVNYAKSLEQVCLEATAYLINYKADLVLHELFGLPCLRQRIKGLPCYKLSEDLSTLHLWARTLGHCKVIWPFKSNVPDIIKQIASTLFYPSITRVSECSDPIRNLARSCVANDGRSPGFTTDQILEAYRTAWEAVATLDDGNWAAIVHRHDRCVQMVLLCAAKLAGKILFGISNGHFGIGGRDVEDGDVVTLPLAGGPLMLRRKNKLDEIESEVFYGLVGAVYVGAVSEGEYMDRELVAELRVQVPMEFLIR